MAEFAIVAFLMSVAVGVAVSLSDSFLRLKSGFAMARRELGGAETRALPAKRRSAGFAITLPRPALPKPALPQPVRTVRLRAAA
ncbi:hypothetical protein [Qipengyuania atrilutea]|uniref:Uncharacterized protein n=1 Tax=Qipengyuania atrilutea TaxID=2744473 RepID=A0A850GXL5_9SPHN|nr:hypothetical protein [Actirhodobacter atriluteus]NVD44311.1 hypothetical protein [Actirhodobacter atriluteus]